MCFFVIHILELTFVVRSVHGILDNSWWNDIFIVSILNVHLHKESEVNLLDKKIKKNQTRENVSRSASRIVTNPIFEVNLSV